MRVSVGRRAWGVYSFPRVPLSGWAVLLVLTAGAVGAAAQWPQWGGPRRDFSCDAAELADKWPEAGPRKLWSVEIGSGHSAIVADAGTLYTMCRRGDKDAVLAFDAATGEKRWETQYDAPTKEGMQLEFGPGPHSTPLIAGDRLFTVGAMVHFHCLDKKTGKILWAHDLADEMKASVMLRGYGASPIAYKDLVILNIGGQGDDVPGVAAFKQETGEVAWRSEHLSGGYPSPMLVEINGEEHLLIVQGADRVGLDPATGKTRWHLTVDRQSAAIMSSPVWVAPDRVFYSAAYGGGSQLIKVTAKDGQYATEDLWQNKMQVMFASMVRIGDLIYGSSGDFGPTFLMATDVDTGRIVWRKRGFGRASLLRVDKKVIILDEEGILALATPSAEGLEIHAKVKLLEPTTWTVPTLVGTTLYARDKQHITALDLSVAGCASPTAKASE